MNPLLAVVLISALSQVQSTTTQSTATAQQQTTQQQTTQQQTTQQQTTKGESNRSALSVQPGQQAIKEKDLYDRTGYMHPFRRMPKFLLVDQKKIWTSPFHTSKQDLKYWAIFGGATALLIGTDKYVEKNAPSTHTLVRVGVDASYLGQSYTLLPIAAGWYFLGTKMGSDHFREAGLLSFEALADTTIVQLVVKSITDRARPWEGNGKGDFWAATSPRYNSGFPSGHSISTFAVGSVLAHEYPRKWWIKVVIYGYGAGVAAARLAANKHFPGDVFAGGVMGWFIGDYVYAKRHNPDLERRSAAQTILSHIRIGGGMY